MRSLYRQFNLEETGKLVATGQNNNSVLNGLNPMADTIELVANHYKLTLRQVAQIFTDINLYIRTLNSSSPLSHCLGLVASLRHVSALPKDLLKAYCQGSESYDRLVQSLIQNGSLKNKRREEASKAYLNVMFFDQEKVNKLQEEYQVLRQRENPLDTRSALTNDHPTVMQCHAIDAYSRLISFDDPIAWVVYCRLEKASLLTQQNQ